MRINSNKPSSEVLINSTSVTNAIYEITAEQAYTLYENGFLDFRLKFGGPAAPWHSVGTMTKDTTSLSNPRIIFKFYKTDGALVHYWTKYMLLKSPLYIKWIS